MDIVLEIFDNLILDQFYAYFFPTRLASRSIETLEKVFHNPTVSNWILSSIDSSHFTVDPAATSNSTDSIYSSCVYGKTPFFIPSISQYANQSLFLRDNPVRQFASLVMLTSVLGILLYLMIGSISYYFLFEKEIANHPKFKKNQMAMEIRQAIYAIPVMSIAAALGFTFEIRGYSKLYWTLEDYGYWHIPVQIGLFFLFTDFGVYFMHRGLHHPLFYKHLHKTHHKWLVSTPFASHAFHPMDGFLQSLPYHVFPFIVPTQKAVYLTLFVIVNVGTVLIHDGNFFMNNNIVHGTACHAVHHLYFNYNYGQYTTLWDRLGGSYRKPEPELFSPSLKNDRNTWNEQAKNIDLILLEMQDTHDSDLRDQ